MTLLKTEGLVAGYNRSPIIQGIDLRVEPGELVAVLGANGAGKTTLLRAIDGMIPVMSGKVYLDGRDVTRAGTVRLARMGVAHVPEGRALYRGLTVREHLIMGGITLRLAEARARIAELEERFPVLRRRNATVDQLSGGEQQILTIARALVARPRLLLLDEPSTGLAPLVVQELAAIVDRLRLEGTGVLLVEQNVPFALKVADRGMVMERGRIVLEGPAEALRTDHQVVDRYLGRRTGDSSAEARRTSNRTSEGEQ